MRLRTKMSAIILFIWAMMFIIVYAGSRIILENSYLQLEDQQASDHVTRALEAMDQMAESVGLIASSNAVWNDAYQFAVDKNDAFIKSNLQLTSLIGFGTDMLLFFNAAGDPVYYAVLNKEHTQLIGLPEGFQNYLTPKSKLVYQPNVDSHIEGLASVPYSILLVASHSIVKGDNTGPVHGTLVAVRYFTPQLMEKLRQITKLNLEIYRMADIEKDNKLTQIFNSLDKQHPYIEKSKNILYGYDALKDINGKPFALMKVTIKRGIYAIGSKSINYFSTAFFIAGIVFVILLLYLFRSMVTNRLENLNRQVMDIGHNKAFGQRLVEEGSDELTSVETEVNKMLDIIQTYNQEIIEAEGFVTNIINAMPSMLIITDENLAISRLNLAAENKISLVTRQAVGKSILDLLPFLKPYRRKFITTLTHNTPQSIDKIDHQTQDGLKHLSVMIYPLHAGNKKYLVTRIDDITERVQISEKLSQSDKLASIGVLTAGVAHEINNPINFVIATIDPLQEDFNEILAILQKYLEIKSVGEFEQNISAIEKIRKENKIDEVIKEIQQLLPSIKEGATRTANIVSDLKSFTRVDEDAMKEVDVHQGIDSTLTLLKHNYIDRINIIKDYGNIPKIDCFPGKLNQVFMNILTNAIDAISGKGEIRIKTWQEGDYILISIKDSGMGIENENISKIFEPFFTTKDVGKGTGLGLSISFGIIRDHSGTIEVISKPNVGTEFIIKLPIKQPM